jgi:hypothetical protein
MVFRGGIDGRPMAAARVLATMEIKLLHQKECRVLNDISITQLILTFCYKRMKSDFSPLVLWDFFSFGTSQIGTWCNGNAQPKFFLSIFDLDVV